MIQYCSLQHVSHQAGKADQLMLLWGDKKRLWLYHQADFPPTKAYSENKSLANKLCIKTAVSSFIGNFTDRQIKDY